MGSQLVSQGEEMWIQQGKGGISRIGDWGKVSTDSVKVKGFADWPILKSVKYVWSFLGFRNFYRKFIPKFSTMAAPLNNLLKKDTAFEWTQETQQAFEELKQRLTSAPVLMMPDQTKPSKLNVMCQSMLLELCWLSWTAMEIVTLLPSCQKLLAKQNATMRSTTGNFLQ